MKKIGVIIILILVTAFSAWVYYKYYFVFGEGVKSGYLNFAVRKGTIFKTYEGKLIQEGLRSSTGVGVQNNEFEFSLENEQIFDTLQYNSGKYFDLHYREYRGVLPWRGNTKYIVDRIVNIK